MRTFVELAPFLLLIAGLGAGLAIFVTLKRELFAIRKLMRSQADQIEIIKQAFTAESGSLKERIQEAEERAGVLSAPPPLRSGLNLSKRSQVMRMAKHGEKPHEIAAALSLPRKEVELLLKVQKIVLSSANYSPSLAVATVRDPV